MRDYFPALSDLSMVIGAIGGAVSGFLGGWDGFLKTLLLFMLIDYVLGVANAIVFKHSTKTTSGGYSSQVGFKGIFKKCVILAMVLISAQLDSLLKMDVIRNAVACAYIANELGSIIETTGEMGVPIPAPIQKAVDLLNKKGEIDNGNESSL